MNYERIRDLRLDAGLTDNPAPYERRVANSQE